MKKILLTVSAIACAFTGIIAASCQTTETVSYQFNTMCTDVSVADITVNKGEEFTLPVPSSRGKEWEFAGWYTNENLTGDPVTSAVAETGTTYYAKWEQLYKLTLDLKGGSLSNADDLYLKAGTNVSTYLAEYIPVKSGYEFGAWQNGTSEIGGAFRMPAQATTLTAKYKVGYSIDVWTQSIEYLRAEDKTGIDEFEKETVTLYAYAQTDFDVEYSMTGFQEISHSGSVTNGDLVDEPQEGDNHFVLYFNRELYTIRLNANLGDTASSEYSYQYYYDEEFVLPYDLYSNVGYVFAGWSESATGKNDYPIDFIDAVLYNKTEGDDSEVKREKYFVSGDATLYAYWNKGYSDMFGGSDTIFYLGDESRDIYLYRGGKYFKGMYTPSNKQFAFYDKQGDNLLFSGKLLDGDKFCYQNKTLEERQPSLYSMKEGLNENIILSFKRYDAIEYIEKTGEGAEAKATGTYTIDTETNEFTATFGNEGPAAVAGKTIHFILSNITTQSGSSRAVFLIRNEEEVALGMLPRLIVSGSQLGSLTKPYYSLSLNGYGIATYYNGNSPTNYQYYYDADTDSYPLISVSSQGSSVVGNAKLIREGALFGYMIYDKSLDMTFTGTNAGELTLDGVKNATYVNGSTVVKGLYTLTTSYFGGYIVTLTTAGSEVYTFLLEAHLDFNTEAGFVTYYTLSRKPNGYMEYYYYEGKDSSGKDQVYAPILVINDEEEGKANLYESNDGFVKSATGTYVKDEDTGLYLFTVTDRVSGIDHSGSKFNIDNISEFLFALDTSAISKRVYYRYSQKDIQNSETVFSKVYHAPADSAQKGMTLTIVGGFAIITEKNEASSVTGTYETNDNGVTRVTTSGGYIYLEINEENGTFIRYDSLYGTAYLYKEDGTTDSKETITFDGKGGAIYTVRVMNSEGTEYVSRAYVGTYEAKENGVFSFLGGSDGEGHTADPFDFVIVTANNRNYFSILSENAGTYTSALGTLVLDGSGFDATYTDTFGNHYRSQYRVRTRQNKDGSTDNIVYIYVNGEYLYFKLDSANMTFELIGNEFGNYLVMDNQAMTGKYLMLDGEGYYVLSEMADENDPDAENGLKKISEGDYTKSADGIVTFSYQVNGLPALTMKGRTGAISVNDSLYNAFFVQYDGIANTYVNEADYSVLVLDDVGGAIRYTQNGTAERGSYTMITEGDYNLFYYVANNGTFARIYSYGSNGIATSIERNRISYYNSSLSSLVFTEYGFAVFNGAERYYYFEEEDGTVAIYRFATEEDKNSGSVTVNRFGYIREEIENGFQTTIERGGETYYKNNDQTISFTRPAENSEKYFITLSAGKKTAKADLTKLSFIPGGGTEFSVKGTVRLVPVAGSDPDFKEGDYNCTVVKKRLPKAEGHESDPDVYETYIMLGNFRYDIGLTYSSTVENCNYTVQSMRFYVDADSYLYRYTVALYAMLLGSTSAAEQMVPFFGHITIWEDYDEQGDAVGGMFMTGKFGETVQCLDTNNNIINFEQQPCESSNGYFTVTVDHSTEKGGDGYTYKGVFQLDTSLGMVTYRMVSFCREQKFTQSVGGVNYEITVQRVITSEQESASPGRLYSLAIATVDGDTVTAIEPDSIFNIKNVWNIIVRETDPDTKKIISSVFYKIPMTEKEIGSGINDKLVKPYASVSLEVIKNVETVYSEDGKSYVDILGDEVLSFRIGRTDYIVSESAYDATTGIYTATMYSGAQYKITIETVDGGKVAKIEPVSA